MEQSFQHFIGIDWGTQLHRIAVMDDTGRVVEQYNADHSGEGLFALVKKIKQRTACEPALVAIGIEGAWGALVETLVESGFTVFSINPKQVDRFRDRFTVAGAKDDARGALVLASSLYTDSQSYRQVEIDPPEFIRLRELSRFEDELKIELRRGTNGLCNSFTGTARRCWRSVRLRTTGWCGNCWRRHLPLQRVQGSVPLVFSASSRKTVSEGFLPMTCSLR